MNGESVFFAKVEDEIFEIRMIPKHAKTVETRSLLSCACGHTFFCRFYVPKRGTKCPKCGVRHDRSPFLVVPRSPHRTKDQAVVVNFLLGNFDTDESGMLHMKIGENFELVTARRVL